MEKVQESSEDQHSSTYPITSWKSGSVALEDGVMDLQTSTNESRNSSALEVSCPPPGIGRKVLKTAWNYLHE
jgi:hypothetical protein